MISFLWPVSTIRGDEFDLLVAESREIIQDPVDGSGNFLLRYVFSRGK